MTRTRLGIAILIAILATPLLSVGSVAARTGDVYPDLQMAPMYSVELTTVNGQKQIRFGTIVYNVGDGPIEVRAKRRVGDRLTKIFQVIKNSDGTMRRVRKYNTEVFYSGDGHDHFHIARFIIVRLNPAPGNTYTMPERRLRKIGFCLVDSLRINDNPPPNQPSFGQYSGCGNVRSTFVRMGISVGYGDVYAPYMTFQDIDVADLPAGNYRLCATVNPFGLWAEKAKNYTNNTKWTDVAMDVATNQLQVIGTGEGPC